VCAFGVGVKRGVGVDFDRLGASPPEREGTDLRRFCRSDDVGSSRPGISPSGSGSSNGVAEPRKRLEEVAGELDSRLDGRQARFTLALGASAFVRIHAGPSEGEEMTIASGAGEARGRRALTEPNGLVSGLLLEGAVLTLQADLRRLEACTLYWNATKGRS
jgi:hypothetical protein